ncbi:MAG: hypothetical protein EOM70_08560 [Clostridia bacterium]|nr:hypothetical protein [Clostridia bacterium]
MLVEQLKSRQLRKHETSNKKKVTHVSSGKVLSIDIGKGTIHLVVGSNKNGILEVDSAFSIPTPEGAVKEGMILDRSALAFAINELIKESGIKVSKGIVSVKSTSIITRELTMPEVPPADILPLILLEMEQYLPNIAKDYRTGVTLIESQVGAGARQNKVRVFAMPDTMAEEYASLLKDCHLKPLYLDVHANGLNKLVQRTVAANKDKVGGWDWKLAAFVDLGKELTEISILNSEKLLFTRQVPYGSAFMDTELMRQTGTSETALVTKKQELVDLVRSEFVSEEARKFNDIVRPYVSRVTNEIQTVIQFYSGRVAEKRPEIIYLFGGNAHLKSLAELMEQAIGIPVRVWNDTPAIHVSVKAGALDVINYVNACAAFYRND